MSDENQQHDEWAAFVHKQLGPLADIPFGTYVGDGYAIAHRNTTPNIVFNGPLGEVGRLTIVDDQLIFTGNADEAARLFFEHVLKPMVDAYIAGRLPEGE